MSTATMTSKGQVTIPIDVRQQMGLDAGDRIEFIELEPGAFLIRPAVQEVTTLKGLLRKPPKPVTVDDMNAAIRARGGQG